MAIPVQQFPMLSFEQMNPFASGWAAGQNLYKQAVSNQYLQPSLQQELLKAQLNNQILQPQAEYARPMEQAKLAYNQTLAPLNNAQIADIYQGRIPLQKAQAGLAGAQTGLANQQTANERNFPLKDEMNGALSMYRTLAQQYGENSPQAQQAKGVVNVMANKAQAMAAYYGANTQYKNLPVEVKDQMIAEGAPVGTAAHLGGQSQANIFGGQPQQQPQQNPTQGAPWNIPLLQPQQQNAPQQNSPLAKQLTDYNSPEVQNIARSGALKKTETTAQLNQKMYGETLGALMTEAQPLIPSVVKFAGLAGQANKRVDQFASAAGLSNDPDYQNYQNYTRVIAPQVAGEIGRVLGRQATDNERGVLDKIANPSYWDSNPQLALSQLNTLSQTAAAVSGQLAKSPAQMQQGTEDNSKNTIQFNAQSPASSAPKGMVQMEYNGQIWNVPKDKADVMKKNGGKPVG